MTTVIRLHAPDHDQLARRTLDSIRVGLIVQHVTRCHPDTRVLISADIDDRYDIDPPQDVHLFTHPHTRRRHALALLGIARIIQEHTGVSDRDTLLALAELACQYTFTPRHQEAA